MKIFRFFIFFSVFLVLFISFPILNKVLAENAGTVWQWEDANIQPSQKENLQDVVQVSTGYQHNLALKKDGTVWAWGNNNHGELGNGASGESSETPVQVKGADGEEYLTDVKMVAAGYWYSIALKKDGTVWIWGFNGYGARGTYIGRNDQFNLLLTPTQVKGLFGGYLTDVTSIAAGYSHSMALRSDKSVITWGKNSSGQIGNGCFLYNCSLRGPTKVFEDVIYIAAGGDHSLVVKSDGTVWGWGDPSEGQLGSFTNGTSQQPSPIQISGLSNIKAVSAKYTYNAALSITGEVFEWGASRYIPDDANPRQVPGLHNVAVISAGIGKTGIGIVLTDNGQVWQWNSKDMVAEPLTLKNINSISGGDIFTSNLASTKLNPPPEPFLELPFDYQSDNFTFNEAALSINSYFDHEYPFLSASFLLKEPPETSNTVVTFKSSDRKDVWYSSHDGYDYGSPAKVHNGDPVLAAASGSATFINTCGACGNMIKINHHNGYKTIYMHLQKDGLITSTNGETIQVKPRQQIGKVGSTGNSTGPHIHFAVVQDKNNDNNFQDNIPDGMTDPFGWDSKDVDPWENYSFFFNGLQRTGNKSHYLWKNLLDNKVTGITILGGKIVMGKFTVDILENTFETQHTVEMKAVPGVKVSESLISLGSVLDIIIKDPFGALATLNNKKIILTIDFSQADISKFKTGTLSIYSSSDHGKTWKKEETLVDYFTKKATTEVDHLTLFALIAERADTTPPVTTPRLEGTEGSSHNFRSEVQLSLHPEDNENGLGIDYTLYKKENGDWETYTQPLTFIDEGKHKIEYYSGDKDGNVEEIKTIEFTIDQTPPEALLHYDTQKQNITITGKDTSNQVTIEEEIIKEHKEKITISDPAGNTLILNDVDKDQGPNSKIEIKSLTYNGQETLLERNIFSVRYQLDENDNIKNFVQTYHINDEEKIKLDYDYKTNMTTILQDKQKTALEGIKFLQLETQKGEIKYSY